MISWPFGRRPLDLDWIQVEVTSRCNAACRYCPRTKFAARWLTGDLDPELLAQLLPELRPTTLVHLQGWGEPLLHPRLVEMVAMARGAGHEVATTSNGLLLDQPTQEALAGEGLGIIGLSLVGVDEWNDEIRSGTTVRRVLEVLESLASLRERSGSRRPRIHIAYLVLRSRLQHLPEAVRVLGEAGADQVVVSSLDLVPDEDLVGETFWNLGGDETQRMEEVVGRAEEAAERSGTELLLQLALGEAGSSCPEANGRSLYVGFDGGVLPCVMSAVPVGGRYRHWSPRGAAEAERVPYGFLGDQPFRSIWRERDFRKFRRGVSGWGPQPVRCGDCAKLRVRRVQGDGADAGLEDLIPG